MMRAKRNSMLDKQMGKMAGASRYGRFRVTKLEAILNRKQHYCFQTDYIANVCTTFNNIF